MSARSRKILKWLLGSLIALAVVIALLFATFGFIVGRVPEYRVQVQDWINQRSGLIVEFRTLSARLRLYGPELVFDDAVVRTPDRTRTLFTAQRGSIGFDLWNSIANGRLTGGRFALEGPEIGLIRTREGKIQLLGQSALPERDKPIALDQMPTGRFVVHDAVVSFRDEITGRGPWSLSGVHFDLTRSSDSMRVKGTASLPPALGHELEFSGSTDGKLEQSERLISAFSVKGDKIDLAGWADLLPDAWPAPESGHGTVSVNGILRGAELLQLAATVDVGQLTTELPVWTIPLPAADPLTPPASGEPVDAKVEDKTAVTEPVEDDSPPPPQVLSYERLAFGVRAQKTDNQWAVTLSQLNAKRSDSTWQAKEITARFSRDEEGALKISGQADRLVLDNVWPWLSYLPESQGGARVRAMQAKGALVDTKFSLVRPSRDAQLKYALESKLESVGFLPVLKTPGLTNISGQLQVSDQSGQLRLAARQVEFNLPRSFRNVLLAPSVDGTLNWQRDVRGLVVTTDQLRVQGADGRAVARVNLLLPADGSSPVLDLFAQGQDLKVASTPKYLPADRMGPRTLEWFDRAFIDGQISSAEFTYKGPMRSFPFRKNEGVFLARAQVENAVLDYQPGWPQARDIKAEVEFRNQAMHIRTTAGMVGNVRLNQATADIADFKQNDLLIKATTGGDLDAGLSFVKSSPIGPRLGETFARLGGRGPMTADVRLELPLKQLDQRKIDITTRLANATLTMQKINAPVRELTGDLTIKNSLVASGNLQGTFLGGPLNVTIKQQNLLASDLTAEGHATAEDLQRLFALPAAVKLSGDTDWHMNMRIDSAETEAAKRRTVRIESDLRGLGLQLPEPLGKSAADLRELQVTLDTDDEQIMTRTSLGDVRALIRMKRGEDGWTLDRGGVRADAVSPALPSHRGFRVEGALKRFVLDDWLALRGDQPANPPNDAAAGEAKALSDYLQAANVRVGDFHLFGYHFPDVRGVLQATQSGWRVDVSGDSATGQVLIPQAFTGAQPLRATMEHLVLAKVPQGEGVSPKKEGETDPRNLPNLQVYVGSLRLEQRVLGALDLKASRVPQGIRFDNVTLLGDSARADAQGQWLNTVDGQHSSLAATFESKDVAATLRGLNYPPFIEAKRGAIKANLSWRGGFSGNLLEHASGAISVDAETGQIVNLQPGAGRVLGLFSVGALPRRLALDFSDLTEKGLAFDTVHGDFELRDGNAYTSNLLLRGPAAEIGIAGRTGLGSRDYDQTAVVTGNLGASPALAGALAGGPAVGAAVLLFSQIFKEPLKGITRGYYRITGPWDDPVVERVDASAAKAEVTGD